MGDHHGLVAVTAPVHVDMDSLVIAIAVVFYCRSDSLPRGGGLFCVARVLGDSAGVE